MRSIFILATAVSFGVLMLPSRAQQPAAAQTKAAQTKTTAKAAAPAAAEDKPLIFTTGSRLVVVDVTVKDKSGHTINGLKASDFAVTEDGQKQKVEVFEPQVLTMEPEPPPKLELTDELKLPETPTTTITFEAPGKVQYHDKRLLVLFFDFSSMAVSDQLRAQDAALEYLTKSITKDDVVSVMLYTSTVNILTDFTQDREILTQVIKGMPIGEATELAGLADTGSCTGEDTGAAFVADQTEFNILNTDQKLAALETVAKTLSNLPEKKVMVYISGGVSKTGIDNQAQMEASVNALMKANVVMYPLDARGLMADPPGGGASTAGSRGTGAFNGSNYNSQRATVNDSQETLTTLAADTGGKAFLDSNDLALGIKLAQESVSSYYILGYYTNNMKEDGKFRTIKVSVPGNPLATNLTYRKGYYADKDWHKMNGEDKEQQLKEAIAAGDPVTDLPLAMEVDIFRIGPTQYFVPVSVRVPGSVVELAAKGNGGTTKIDFLGQIQDETKATVGNVRDFITITLDQENKEVASKRVYQYDAGFTLEPGRYKMKFLVRENVTGKMGTEIKSFFVPDLSADTSGLKTSTIVYSNQRESLKAAVGAAEKLTTKTVSANPLIDGDTKIMPNVGDTKIFRRRQNMFVTFDVYDARPDPANTALRHVKVSMSLFTKDKQTGADKLAFQIAPLEFTQIAGTRPDAVPVKLQVPLKDLAPGEYTSQINVVDEVGRKFAFPREQVVITQ
ncbi:MAG TPA: VWA domain-containing protein [Bryobacteraceae bacterium]|jgi:VWFA-related protein